MNQLSQTSFLELIAVTTGVLSVWYGMKEKIWVFPLGIISVGIYIYITYTYKLYADSGINTYYLIMSAYGWVYWKRTPNKGGQIAISSCSTYHNVMNILVCFLSLGILYFALSYGTDSDVPLWDASTTALAITAMYLMALKKIEHWYYWILCDLSSIPLYFYKGLPFTVFQFILFTVIAILGAKSWRKKITLRQHPNVL